MRKILIGSLMLILIIGIYFTIVNGVSLGNVQISSIKQLKEQDEKIEKGMNSLKQMKNSTFPQLMEELNKSAKDLKSKREEYASLINSSAEGEMNAAITTQKYEVEYLWVKLGNYATKNGITLKLNVLNSTSGQEGVYDLQFTLNGKYKDITEFIYEIENDSSLGFKINNFSLTPSTGENNDSSKTASNSGDIENLTATFTVKEVYIDIQAGQVVVNTDNTTQQQEKVENTTTDNTVQ